MAALEARLDELGADAVLCVLSSTSCFAPRAPDRLVPLARLCAARGVPHVVNNAYGVQSRALMRLVEAAAQNGRVDAVVQSTDKNLGVPVGGAIVAACGKGPGAAASTALLAAVGAAYAGRASVSPVLDAFCTLLYLGADGYAALVSQREANMDALRTAVARVAARHGERVLASADNPISIAVTLGGCLRARRAAGEEEPARAPAAADDGAAADGAARELRPFEYTAFGARLFQRLCSGCRVVVPTDVKTIEGVRLVGFGAHVPAYPHVYFTVAAGLGQSAAEIELFAKRLDATFAEFAKAHGGTPSGSDT